jgi:hypothetical protein
MDMISIHQSSYTNCMFHILGVVSKLKSSILGPLTSSSKVGTIVEYS